MKSSVTHDIQAMLSRYLAGDITLETFYRWFVPVSWTADQSKEADAAALASEIDLRLAEFSRGHWTEPELIDQLRHLVPETTRSR